MQNLNSFNLNKQMNQQQQLFQAQQQQQQQQHIQQAAAAAAAAAFSGSVNTIEPSALDYSLSRANLLAFSQQAPLNLSHTQQLIQQQQYQHYHQKKLNYSKTKIKSEQDYTSRLVDEASASNNNKFNNEDKDIDDDDYNSDNYEMNPTNLDSSFSNYSYSNEQSSADLVAKNSLNNNNNKKQKSSINLQHNNLHHQKFLNNNTNPPIKQELQDVNDFTNKKRRESINNDDDDSEMNDDDDDHTNQMNDSKEKRPKSDLNCVVCDSPANGYNFDAVTCESCKAFFRRNAFRPINLFRCSNNDSCVITVATRKKCKKCRIAKCFRLGMRRDWIMTEVEREEKRKKIEENRRRKQSNGNQSNDLDAMNQSGGPSSNMSNQYDEYSNQNECTSGSNLPVRRRRRRRRNSWFDINNKKQPQQPIPSNNSTNKPNNDLNNKQSSVTVSTEKQNSPLSSSSSSSSSSSFTNRNRFNEQTNLSLNEINENISQASFNLHSNPNLMPFNLVTKQSLETNISSPKIPSLNQFLIDNNSKTTSSTNLISSSSFVLSPTVQQQLAHTFEQQQRQLMLKNSLDFNNTHSNNPSSGNEMSFNQQYAAAAAVAAMAASSVQQQLQQQQNASFSTPFNLNSNSPQSVPSADQESTLEIDKKFDPRRRRKLKEDDTKLPVNQLQQHNMMSNFDISAPPQAINTLLPSLKYLTKSNINTLSEIKLNNNNKNESTYISFSSHTTTNSSEHTDLVRSPRVLSPVSSTSSSSSSSSLSSCDQYQFNQTNSSFSNENVSIKMTDLQRKQVEAIQTAYKQAIQLVKAQNAPKNSQDINTTINITELGVRRIIFYFKLISDFRELKHDLMVVLLKFNMMSLLQIHGINSYNKEDNTFKEPDTDDTPFSAQSIESVYGTSVYELSISITRNLFDLCAGDMTHIKILMLIVLFDPYNDKLNETEKILVAKLQNKYVTLLHAYLCELLGSPRANHTFKLILIEISKINDLGKWFEKTVTEKSSSDFVRPLMKEVFGIATPANSTSSTPIASSQPSSIGSSCSAKSVKQNHDAMIECTTPQQNDSNYETPTTCSTSLSDSSFSNHNLNNTNSTTANSKQIISCSSSPNK